jgi:phosphoribosyl-AMP cyclohydrolase
MFIDNLKYDEKGLVCGVFQDFQTGEVLTIAWLNKEAVQLMWDTKRGTVYRRSKGQSDDEGRGFGQRANRSRNSGRLRPRCFSD